jgi:putative flippase GtrA
MSARAAERRRLTRFLLVGGSNTALTYALFVLLSQVIDQLLAYTTVFVAGVVYSVLLTGSFVFGARRRLSTSLAYAGSYLLVYGIGVLVLQLMMSAGVERAALTGLAVLSVTAPLNYLGGRLLFRPESDPILPERWLT